VGLTGVSSADPCSPCRRVRSRRRMTSRWPRTGAANRGPCCHSSLSHSRVYRVSLWGSKRRCKRTLRCLWRCPNLVSGAWLANSIFLREGGAEKFQTHRTVVVGAAGRRKARTPPPTGRAGATTQPPRSRTCCLCRARSPSSCATPRPYGAPAVYNSAHVTRHGLSCCWLRRDIRQRRIFGERIFVEVSANIRRIRRIRPIFGKRIFGEFTDIRRLFGVWQPPPRRMSLLRLLARSSAK
jgi:hypothetical protein